MCSGELLEEKVQEFCKNNNRDEGQIWQVINEVHTRTYGRNIMWEKEQYQKKIIWQIYQWLNNLLN